MHSALFAKEKKNLYTFPNLQDKNLNANLNNLNLEK